jgi:phosphate:Na+ symporter
MLLGGLALFLYGMKIMGEGLELAAGSHLKKILEKLTTNKYLGMLFGIFITAIIQSSSATTVMVVGFVNSGLMTLSQSVGIIMGANVGTTITSQIIALNISQIAPLIAFVGILIILLAKKRKRLGYLGEIIIGLGILFIGINSMSDSMAPLKEVKEFQNIMIRFENPIMGVLIGTAVTCVIQSSSASIGILQALASQGLVGIANTMYIIFGQNIGTCITTVLASIGSSKNAKRTALCHVLFNVIGAIIFIAIAFTLPFEKWMIALAPNSTVKQIANVHSIFNLGTTIILLPFSNFLVKTSLKWIPDDVK